MQKSMGLIGLGETIFSWPILLTALVVLVTLPLLNAALHPRQGEQVTEIDASQYIAKDESGQSVDGLFADNTVATRPSPCPG